MLQITEEVREDVIAYIRQCPTPATCSLNGALNLIQHLQTLKPIEKKNDKDTTKPTKNKSKKKNKPEILEKNG